MALTLLPPAEASGFPRFHLVGFADTCPRRGKWQRIISHQHPHRAFPPISSGRRQQLGVERAVDERGGRRRGSPSSAWTTAGAFVLTNDPLLARAHRMMVACGGLITAENSRMPNMPRLETAVRAAGIFVGLEASSPGRGRRGPSSRRSWPTGVLVSALRITGVNSPPSIARRRRSSEFLNLRIRSSAQTALAFGTRWSASASALMTKSLTESL